RATAIVLAEEGYDLILTGRREDRLEQLEVELSQNNPNINIRTLNFDVRNQPEVEHALTSLQSQNIDVLINNAGLAKRLSAIHEDNLEHREQMIDTNIKEELYVSKIVSGWMVKQQKGQIINVCSVAGKEPYPRGNVYCATDHAVDALTHSMRI